MPHNTGHLSGGVRQRRTYYVAEGENKLGNLTQGADLTGKSSQPKGAANNSMIVQSKYQSSNNLGGNKMPSRGRPHAR